MTINSLLTQYELQPVHEVTHNRQVWTAGYSPCGQYLVATGYDGQVHRWKITGDAYEVLPPFTEHNGWVQCMVFAADREHVLTGDSWGRLSCWRYTAETPELVWTHPSALAGWIRGLVVSPDGNSVAAAGSDSHVRVWSISDGSLLHELGGHPDDVFSICFHPHEPALITGDWKGIVRHWDLQSGKIVRELNYGDQLYCLHRIQDCGGARVLAFDAEGRTLACGGQKDSQGSFATGIPAVLLINWKTGELQQELEVGGKDEGFVYDAQFHPDGFLMTVACGMPSKGKLMFWKPGETEPLFTGKEVINGRSLSLHPNGQQLAVVTSVSQNRNGRLLKDGEYEGGTATIRILQFPNEPAV